MQLFLRNNKKKKKCQGMDVFSSVGKYLVQPFPLEWNCNLYENCNDPCEVNVTHNLGSKRRKHDENNSTILIEPLFPEKQLKQFPDNSLCQTSLFMLLDKHGRYRLRALLLVKCPNDSSYC